MLSFGSTMKRGVTVVSSVLCWSLVMLFNESCDSSRSSVNAGAGLNDTVPLTRSWEKAIPHQEVPSGLTSLHASECGKCHTEIYEEWKTSIHAVAWQDPQFQAEWKKDNVYACINCHTPLQNQQEYIVTGLLNGDLKTPVQKLNPNFDQLLQAESITCATCHVREGNVIGTQSLLGVPHAMETNLELLSEQICLSCHNVAEELNPTLVCTFETGDEWMGTAKKQEGNTCITCHMPDVDRPLLLDGEIRPGHTHSFPGSGIPKFANRPVPGLQGLEITEGFLNRNYSAGDTLKFELSIKNKYAGHNLPTGDPERFYLVNYVMESESGEIVSEAEFRIGEKWQWFPVAEKLADNNLKSMEERAFPFSEIISGNESFVLRVSLTKHRITKENADYNGLGEDYPRSISVFEKEYLIHVE